MDDGESLLLLVSITTKVFSAQFSFTIACRVPLMQKGFSELFSTKKYIECSNICLFLQISTFITYEVFRKCQNRGVPSIKLLCISKH